MSLGVLGLVLSMALGVFSVVQTAVDVGIDRSSLRWVLPSCVTLSVLLAALLIQMRRIAEKSVSARSPTEQLGAATLAYAQFLRREGRDQALVSLRSNLSSTLHVLGLHSARIAVGQLALESAAIRHDQLSLAEILVDDLGWANHLAGSDSVATSNIQKGVKVALDLAASQPDSRIRGRLCAAKGLRHLAVLASEQRTECAARLDEAEKLLRDLPHDRTDVKRDVAQILHARAWSTALRYRIHREGTIIRSGDTEGDATVRIALKQLRQAAKVFHEVSDLERYAKCLSLEVRMLEALADSQEAIAVAALRDRTLAQSEWVMPAANDLLIGR